MKKYLFLILSIIFIIYNTIASSAIDGFSNTFFDKFFLIFAFWLLGFVLLKLLFLKSNDLKDYKSVSLEELPFEFKKLYSKLFQENIVLLKKSRKDMKNSIFYEYSIYFLIMSFIVITFKLSIYVCLVSSFLIILFTLTRFLSKYSFMKDSNKEYTYIFKKNIISAIVSSIDNNLTYRPYDTTLNMKNKYASACFLEENYNKLYVDDIISGNIDNNLFIEMCNINVKGIQVVYDDCTSDKYSPEFSKSTYEFEIFDGLFTQITLNKHINSTIHIIKNNTTSNNNKKTYSIDSNLQVELDNIDFEKRFDVFSDNKILAIRILTSDTMEYLLDFYNKYKINFEIVIKNNFIYIRFFTGPMFEPQLFKDSLDISLLYNYYSIIKFVLNISKKLNSTLRDIEI